MSLPAEAWRSANRRDADAQPVRANDRRDGSADEVLKQGLLDQGAFGYMRKPLDFTKLLDMVQGGFATDRADTAP